MMKKNFPGQCIIGKLNVLFERCIHRRGTFLYENICACVYKVQVADTVYSKKSRAAVNDVPDTWE